MNKNKNGLSSTVQWGSAITDDGVDLVNALKAACAGGATGDVFTGSDAKTAINGLTAANNKYAPYDVTRALEKIQGNDAKVLASVISKLITDDTTVAGSYAGNGETAKIDVEEAGYYFVKDTTSSLSTTSPDALSKFMIQVAGNAKVNIKTDAPSLVKKIWNNDNTTDSPTITTDAPTASDDLTSKGWNDVGDNKIGDTVYYYVATTVPDMSQYDKYKYIIRDSMSNGLTMNGVTDIVYVPVSGDPVVLKSSTVTTDAITVTVGDDSNTINDVETFYVDFGDLKTVLGDEANGGTIYTYYNATLNENALVSASTNNAQNNPNEAWLSYSSNPNQSGEGGTHPTNDTPKDKVYEWTYTFDAKKVDESGNALAGAKFNLKSGNSTISLVEITEIDDLKVNGITTLDAVTKYYRPAKDGEISVTEIVTDENHNKFMFVGLDDVKEYTLVEIEAPADYTKSDDTKLEISATHNEAGLNLSALSREVDDVTGNEATVVNRKGTALPSTGGIGTTLFYIGGGAMVAVAGVFLITKKRAGKSEN